MYSLINRSTCMNIKENDIYITCTLLKIEVNV